MNPANDALYRLHPHQAVDLGLSPLPYADFCERLRGQTETDLTQLLAPASEVKVRVTPATRPRFQLGTVCITPAAERALPPDEVLMVLARHACGDWGALEPSDRRQNERALASGGRVVSVYYTHDGCRFYVITDAGWRRTTVLLPRDY